MENFVRQEIYQNIGTETEPNFVPASPVTSAKTVEMSDGMTVEEKLNNAVEELVVHIASEGNVHNLTKTDIGLENVDNTADADKSVKYASSAGNANRATTADSANAVAWDKVSGKPESYTPSSHNHDGEYYTKADIERMLSGYSKAKFEYDPNTQTLTITDK